MLRTPLYNFHVQHGAQMVDSAGWEMPLYYTSIEEEHANTRQAASIFDLSCLGRVEIRGNDAEALLRLVCTRQLGDMEVGQTRYSHICNEHGGIIDAVIVLRYKDRWLMVCNAANREKMITWLNQHCQEGDVQINDSTQSTAMLAIQGPQALAQLDETISRTGYTGEDGVELILPAAAAQLLGGVLNDAVDDERIIKPAGWGARDTLRIEAGMPLYGQEIHENIDPISAGASWCVDLEKDFIGAKPLQAIAENGSQYRLVGLELEGRNTAELRMGIMDGNKTVGEVTSATFSPTLKKSIAMGYIQRDEAETGKQLTVDLAGKQASAQIVELPFYKRIGSP